MSGKRRLIDGFFFSPMDLTEVSNKKKDQLQLVQKGESMSNTKETPMTRVSENSIASNSETELFTTKELADLLNTSKGVILSNGRNCFPDKIIEHGKAVCWTRKEAAAILVHMKNNLSHNASKKLKSVLNNSISEQEENNVSVVNKNFAGDRKLAVGSTDDIIFNMIKKYNITLPTEDSEDSINKSSAVTTKEIATMLNTTKDVVLANARKCLTNKNIEQGKTVYWSQEEVTVLLDYMKKNIGPTASVGYRTTVENTTTKMTNALKIHQAMLMMQEAYEDELKAIKAENERQAAQLIEQKPKVDYYDHYMDSKNNFEIEKLGKDSGIGARRIFKFLEADRIIRAKYVDGVKYYESYAYYDRYFQSVMVPFTLPTGEQYSRPKLMLTPEGMSYFMKKYKPVAA